MSAARQLSHETLSQDLYRFGIELCQLAYTMPAGAEDPLIRLSERMVRQAQQEGPPLDRSGSCVGLVIAPSLRDAVASRAETRHAIEVQGGACDEGRACHSQPRGRREGWPRNLPRPEPWHGR